MTTPRVQAFIDGLNNVEMPQIIIAHGIAPLVNLLTVDICQEEWTVDQTAVALAVLLGMQMAQIDLRTTAVVEEPWSAEERLELFNAIAFKTYQWTLVTLPSGQAQAGRN